ncbi:MAG: class I SAM-dependent methyltransferase [Myxococcales bacterium]
MTRIDEAGRTSFDRNAELYDAARPPYPEALVDHVVARSGIPPKGRILEIGAGTGKATVPFARRGYAILALEPGANMAAVLRRNVAAFPAVAVEVGTFETWVGANGSFDLVVSAQAFHWVDPAVRCVKAAAALRSGGALALIRNETSGLEAGLRAEMEAAYARWFPAVTWTPARDSTGSKRDELTDEIKRSALFGPVQIASFPWTARYTTRQYLDLLETHSDHALLDPARRTALYAAIAGVIERRGGRIEVPYVAMLLLTVRED